MERRKENDGEDPLCCLCMYRVTGQEITLLETVSLGKLSGFPRVDDHTQQLYVPCGEDRGVSVVSWEDNRFTEVRSLTCVGKCYGVGVLGPQLLCVCDQDSRNVRIVRATDDTVTETLRKPTEVRDRKPYDAAVLGKAILVAYLYGTFVLYENGVSSPGTVVTLPEQLEYVRSISSDGVSRFLLCDDISKAVLILDVSGKLCDKINIDTDNEVWDCTVGDGKLWVACYNGDIVVMSPQ